MRTVHRSIIKRVSAQHLTRHVPAPPFDTTSIPSRYPQHSNVNIVGGMSMMNRHQATHRTIIDELNCSSMSSLPRFSSPQFGSRKMGGPSGHECRKGDCEVLVLPLALLPQVVAAHPGIADVQASSAKAMQCMAQQDRHGIRTIRCGALCGAMPCHATLHYPAGTHVCAAYQMMTSALKRARTF